MVLIASVATVLVSGASSASAAVEFGDTCVANRASEGVATPTLFAISSTSPMPLAAPSGGVITKWKLNLIQPPEPTPITVPQTLKVIRADTTAKSALIVGEDSRSIATGPNVFDVRIPVQAGDRLGLFGPGPTFGTLFCEEPAGPENLIAASLGTVPTGSSAPYEEVGSPIRIPAFAVLEPDADNDGHGDETQDKCPQNATTQAACPPPLEPAKPVSLSGSSVVKRNLITVLVTSGSQATVTVAGSVKLGKGKAAKLNGGTQILGPGVLAQFVVLLPKAVKDKLKLLSRKRTLAVSLTATAPNATGSPTVTALNAKLRGQAKPKPKRKKGTRG